MIATRKTLCRPLTVERLEDRLMLNARFSTLAVLSPTTTAAHERTLAVQPLRIDYTPAHQAPGGTVRAAASPVFDNTTIYSVVTIRNQTNGRVYYSLQWPGEGWKQFSLNAHSSEIHYIPGENVTPKISYDYSFAPGYQDQTYALTSRDFVGGGFAGLTPSRNADGMQYYFTGNGTGTGLLFFADVTLNKNAFAQYRSGISATDFPRLLSNFEVLAAPTRVYNCIAHSLGYHDRWVNPITSSGPNKLAGMDRLYAREGYFRLGSLDFSLRRGMQKVVVYATVQNGVIQAVTHAAIQTLDGAWTSKLGANALIKHLSPNDVAGGLYGVPVAVYARYV